MAERRSVIDAPLKPARREVRLFAEDTGHERFLVSLLERMARDVGVSVTVHVGSARGGHGTAITELRTYQRAIAVMRGERTDLLVVAIAANCHGWDSMRKEIAAVVDEVLLPSTVVACPDPHVERWYMADPVALRDALEVHVHLGARKCERGVYKRLFLDAGARHHGNVCAPG